MKLNIVQCTLRLLMVLFVQCMYCDVLFHFSFIVLICYLLKIETVFVLLLCCCCVAVAVAVVFVVVVNVLFVIVFSLVLDLKQKSFLFSKKTACPVDVIALLLHLCFMPKLLYGSEVFPIQPKILATYQDKLAKTALCTYDAQSNTKALNFIGWKSAKQQQNERTLKFFFHIFTSDYHEICNIALSAFNDQNPLKWVKQSTRCSMRLE